MSTCATLQGPAQHLHRALPVADQHLLGDREPGHLGLAAVEAGDRVGVDRAAEVGDELAGGRGQLAQVVADRVDQCGERVGGDPAAEGAHLVAHEGGPVAG
jgi:hypothetical protein